jgi:hypothetical protein|tara:strand:+ start:312 stop:494 length:183 start_codon:yes stop_codon:yes gene_type:complete
MEDKILSLNQIRDRLSDRNMNTIAKKLDINYLSVAQFAKANPNPTYKILLLISNYLEDNK